MARPRNLGTLQQAALIYGCHSRTVRRMVSNGDLTGYRLPGSRLLRIDLDELEAKLRPIPSSAA